MNDVFAQIFTGIVSNMLTVALFALLSFTVVFTGRFLQKIRSKTNYSKNILIDKNISALISKNISMDTRYHRNTPFKNILPEWDVKFLVDFYDKLTGTCSFNGSCLRLDKITANNKLILDFSSVGFFDLLSTNMTFFPGNIRCNNFWQYISLLTDLARYYSLLAEYKPKIIPKKTPTDIAEILSNNRLANALAVSTNIVDSSGKALIVKRTSKIAISGNVFTVASTGTVTEYDLAGDKGNIVTRAAARELKEETGIDATPENIAVFNIILTKQKYQPIVIAEYGMRDITEALENISSAKDFKKEIQEVLILDMNKVETFFAVLSKLEFSPASAYSLELSFRNFHNLNDEEYRSLFKKHSRRFGNYRLCADWKNRSKVITTS